MKIEIVERKNNPFLKREELKIKIEHLGEKTPEKAAFQIFLSKELGEHANKIDIRKIFSKPGIGMSDSTVYIWKEKVVPVLSEVKKAKKAEPDKKETGEKEVKGEDKKSEEAQPDKKEHEEKKAESEAKGDKGNRK
ncbi:MAG: hypothetical protein J7J92_02495, partial [Candidatus Aenigmarchaeota archaeon]|nr:hypothetical protein [Candidatus Aenigmarchaeota archaeon]